VLVELSVMEQRYQAVLATGRPSVLTRSLRRPRRWSVSCVGSTRDGDRDASHTSSPDREMSRSPHSPPSTGACAATD
jgi:hypothetical protein